MLLFTTPNSIFPGHNVQFTTASQFVAPRRDILQPLRTADEGEAHTFRIEGLGRLCSGVAATFLVRIAILSAKELHHSCRAYATKHVVLFNLRNSNFGGF